MLNIRQATLTDVGQITEIYNDAIEKTTATFDIEPKTLEEQQAWFTAHDDRHPVLIAEKENLVVAWASLSQWSDRCAYSDTAEISLYVKEEHRREGIGKQLMAATIQAGKEANLHTIIARMASSNKISVDLCKYFGFQYIGTMREVGKKFGQPLDVHLMQLIYHST
ncbi:MAG TPA: GNAT family N-acetyltransferase [Dehalococcoidia bacterium]|nr:GNAT family N-acetyltransferase [Dehalococcoidia bacterium]